MSGGSLPPRGNALNPFSAARGRCWDTAPIQCCGTRKALRYPAIPGPDMFGIEEAGSDLAR